MRIVHLIAATGLLAGTAVAGPLNPPAGPVGATMKTLEQAEPRRPIQSLPGGWNYLHHVSEPGSYYLTGNLTVGSGQGGIIVTANDVTIDLNGFQIAGQDGAEGGVVAAGWTGPWGLTVMNGTVTGCGSNSTPAVYLRHSQGARAERLRVHNNRNSGIFVGADGHVSDCMAANNGGHGIDSIDRSLITNCSAVGNGGAGLIIGNYGSLIGCTSSDNAVGLDARLGAVVTGCTAARNTGTGIQLGGGSVLTQCASFDNGGAGVLASRSATIAQCTVASNDGDGIKVTDAGVTIQGCTVRGNLGDGIWVQNGCHIVGNTVDLNSQATGTGAGISLAGVGNRVDSNAITANDVGINAPGGSNLIVRNSFAFNPTGANVSASSTFGQWVFGPNQALNSANAWANIGH